MRILKHVAMAGFIAFLLSPEKCQREDVRDHSSDVVVVIDDDGYYAKVFTNLRYEYIQISYERSISFITERLEIEADYCLLNCGVVLKSDYDKPLSELAGSEKVIWIHFMNKADNA